MRAVLDHETEHTYVVTAIEAATGICRDLWFGKSLRLAVRHQNVTLPQKYRSIYRDYAVIERAA